MTVNHVSLGEVAAFIRGITFKPEDKIDADASDAVVCMRTKNVQDLLDQDDLIAIPPSFVNRKEQYLIEGDILVSTANSWELVGKSCWVPKIHYKATAGGFISILRADRERVFPRYLYHWMNSSKTLQNLRYCGRQTTNISNMSFELACALKLPLPPLPEQKRIAAILDKADSIRRKRQEAVRSTEELMRSVFLEMFGDPVTNPKGWDICRMGDVVQEIESGWSPVCEERQAEENGWGVLKLGAVTSCRYLDSESKALPIGTTPRPDLEVKVGDLLFTRKNTYNLVAASALVFTTHPKLMLSDLIFRLKLKKDAAVTCEYLWALLTNTGKRKQVQSLAGGSSGSMPNISKAKLMEQMIEVPPLALQEKYSKIVHRNHSIWNKLEAAVHKSEALFNSLLQSAFNGAL